MNLKKRILVAPLNWGLGHATRCIPIINELISHEFEPVIASDGTALELLKKEFPNLIHVQLPSYNITYSKHEKSLKWSLINQIPKLISIIKAETKITHNIIENYQIHGIISDNRFGVYSNQIPSVYITHQLNVLSGNFTWFSTKIHQHIINKFDICWIPDHENELNFSGFLGHLKHPKHRLNLKYIGPLSRFNKVETTKDIDILVLLSGPEPQRSELDQKLINELSSYNVNIVFVRGIIEDEQYIIKQEPFTIYNFMTSNELETTINKSNLVIARSGYTTIMDLAKLNKSAFFIPTPGQYEQEYLAKRLQNLKLAPYCSQNDFNLNVLNKIECYEGLSNKQFTTDFDDLFGLFQSEGELTTNS